MLAFTNDHHHSNYRSLSSEPLHNAQEGAPVYISIGDQTSALNASAKDKTCPLTDFSADNQSRSLTVLGRVVHDGSYRALWCGPEDSENHPFLQVARSSFIPAFSGVIAGAYTLQPNHTASFIAGAIGLSCFAYSLFCHRSELKYQLRFGIPAFGLGVFLSYAYNQGWVVSCTERCGPIDGGGGSSPLP